MGQPAEARMSDLDAETALLGALLSGYPHLDEIQAVVFPTDFQAVHHERIFAAACSVVEAGGRVDPVTVRVALGPEADRLPGGSTYLVDLASGAPAVMSAPAYAKEVKAQSTRRRLISAAVKLNQLATSGLPLSEIVDKAKATVDEAVETTHVNYGVRIGDVLPAVLDIAQNGKSKALSTGWGDIDRFIQGLAPGRLIVVGARPGVGKSLMGTNLALHVAHKHQHAVLMCSMEMGREEVTQRIIAAHAKVNLTTLENGTTTPDSWKRIAERTNDVLAMPIQIEDDPNQTITSIRLALRQLKRQRDDVALVVVDYLQLMQARDRKVNRAEQIGEFSRGLKIMAREFNVCVVAMAQVNRESTRRHDGRPTQADLRESGSIEADADIVILLHRPSEDDISIEVLVEKNRSGPKGMAMLQIHGHYARLVEVAWSPSRGIA